MIDEAIRSVIDQAAPITLDEVERRAAGTSTRRKRQPAVWFPRAVALAAVVALVAFGSWQLFASSSQRVETASTIGSAPSAPATIVAPTLTPPPTPSEATVAQPETPAADKPSIDDEIFGDGSAPFFQFRGTTDALESARGFLDAQFPGWSGVNLLLDEAGDRTARVRWTDVESGATGWMLLALGDGAFMVWDLTTDGFEIDLAQASGGSRGFAQSDRAVTAEFYNAVPQLDTAQYDPTTLITRQQISGAGNDATLIELPPTGQDLRVFLFDESGQAAGIAIVTLEQPGQPAPVDEVIVVTTLDATADLETFIREHPQLLSDYLIHDPWPSADMISRLPASDGVPTVSAGDVPAHHLTQIALEATGPPAAMSEFLTGIAERGTVIEAVRVSRDDWEPLDDVPRYVVDEVPGAAPCRMLGVTGADNRSGAASGDRAFESPIEAAEAVPVSINRQGLGLLQTEFVTADGNTIGFGWHYPGEPRTFLLVIGVEQTANGWMATTWQSVGC